MSWELKFRLLQLKIRRSRDFCLLRCKSASPVPPAASGPELLQWKETLLVQCKYISLSELLLIYFVFSILAYPFCQKKVSWLLMAFEVTHCLLQTDRYLTTTVCIKEFAKLLYNKCCMSKQYQLTLKYLKLACIIVEMRSCMSKTLCHAIQVNSSGCSFFLQRKQGICTRTRNNSFSLCCFCSTSHVSVLLSYNCQVVYNHKYLESNKYV